MGRGWRGALALKYAATLTVVLSKGTKADQVHNTLRLFFGIRYERTGCIQDFARGADQSTNENSGVPPVIDPATSFKQIHCHDASTFVEHKLGEYLKVMAC